MYQFSCWIILWSKQENMKQRCLNNTKFALAWTACFVTDEFKIITSGLGMCCFYYEGWNFNCGKAAVTYSFQIFRPLMYSPTLCRTHFQRWSLIMPLAAPVLLLRTERPTSSIISSIVLNRLQRSGSSTLRIKPKSQVLSGEYGGW